MKLLVTGSEGQLGRELMARGGRSGHELFGFGRPALDITDPARVKRAVDAVKPELIINTAAYTRVDQAENEADLAYRVNRDGPEILAGICADADIPLIQISTDYVFDGRKTGEYVETDAVCPGNVYGRSKADGEQAVRSRLKRHIIIRTSWLYGVYGRNFAKTMLRLGTQNRTLRVVSDQFGCPTSAAELAAAILTVATWRGSVPWGTYHCCGKGITSWYRFAEAIFATARVHDEGLRPELQPIPTTAYPTPAKRPKNSALCCDGIKRRFGISPRPWEESLKKTIDRIFIERTR